MTMKGAENMSVPSSTEPHAKIGTALRQPQVLAVPCPVPTVPHRPSLTVDLLRRLSNLWAVRVRWLRRDTLG
jgi:hypothetical protein